MPTLTFSVQPDGLLIPVMIGLDAPSCRALQQAGQAIPRPLQLTGVMDTATDVPAIAPRVLKVLALPQLGSAQTHTASGSVTVGIYEVSLSILPPAGSAPMFTAPHLVVSELIHAAPGIEVLVGLDIIWQGVLNIDGPNLVFSFLF